MFEIDQPSTQAWKRARLTDLGRGVPDGLRLVPVDLETTPDWRTPLAAAGFDPARPALVVSAGVSMYLTRDTTVATLREVAELAPGTTFAMTFLLPPDLLDEADRAGLAASQQGAQAAGTPFRSFYSPDDILKLAHNAGFSDVHHVPSTTLTQRYFAGRPDGLRPSTGEDLLLATV